LQIAANRIMRAGGVLSITCVGAPTAIRYSSHFLGLGNLAWLMDALNPQSFNGSAPCITIVKREPERQGLSLEPFFLKCAKNAVQISLQFGRNR
jgi:hypothetical protein